MVGLEEDPSLGLDTSLSHASERTPPGLIHGCLDASGEPVPHCDLLVYKTGVAPPSRHSLFVAAQLHHRHSTRSPWPQQSTSASVPASPRGITCASGPLLRCLRANVRSSVQGELRRRAFARSLLPRRAIAYSTARTLSLPRRYLSKSLTGTLCE